MNIPEVPAHLFTSNEFYQHIIIGASKENVIK